jgi:putative ABC transport system permease protein
LVWRNLSRKAGRTVLLVVAIAAAFLLFGLLSAVQRNFTASESMEAERRLVVTSRVGFTQPLPIGYLERIRGLPGVAGLSHSTLLGGYFRERRNLFPVVATDPASYLRLYPEFLLSPQERDAFVRDRGSVLVGKSLATRFGWKAGDIVPLRSMGGLQGEGHFAGSYRIAGVFTAAERSTGTGIALLHYEAFNSSRGADRDTVGGILILSSDPRGNDDLARRIDALFADSPYRTRTVTEQEFGRAMVAQLGNIKMMVVAISGAGFFAILLIVATATATSVRERRSELAVLRTLGFAPSRIARMILAEACAVTLLGGLIGLSLATRISDALRPLQNGLFARMEVTLSTLGLAIAIMLVFALLGSLAPMVQVLRMPVSGALARRGA